jgi:hypothetical protein
MIGAIKQLGLLGSHWRQFLRKGFVYIDVASRAGTASAAKSQDFLDPAVTYDLHDA